MPLEVEQKYRVAEARQVLADWHARGIALGESIEQVDRYFAHPARDFAQTDEALRLRGVGERLWITYKGPKLDATTKTRREIELPLGEGPDKVEQFSELLVALGFRPVREVRKQRRAAHRTWQGFDFELVLDEVAGLGAFVELETTADASTLAAAREALTSLAAELALGASERRSYLELLLERQQV